MTCLEQHVSPKRAVAGEPGAYAQDVYQRAVEFASAVAAGASLGVDPAAVVEVGGYATGAWDSPSASWWCGCGEPWMGRQAQYHAAPALA